MRIILQRNSSGDVPKHVHREISLSWQQRILVVAHSSASHLHLWIGLDMESIVYGADISGHRHQDVDWWLHICAKKKNSKYVHTVKSNWWRITKWCGLMISCMCMSIWSFCECRAHNRQLYQCRIQGTRKSTISSHCDWVETPWMLSLKTSNFVLD